jgi:hypothetical protein
MRIRSSGPAGAAKVLPPLPPPPPLFKKKFVHSRLFIQLQLLSAVFLLHILFAACKAAPAASDTKAITSFIIGAAEGVIAEQTITVTVPYGTDITALSPVIQFTGNSVSPASETAQDFTSPVTYRVTADDGSSRDYTVTVQLEGRTSIEITFTPLPHETVDISAASENSLSRAQNDTLRITAAGMPDAAPVQWFIDGKKQQSSDAALTIAARDYPVGKHHVTALVYKEEIPYSDELIFEVVK